jgi:hypothetical protein
VRVHVGALVGVGYFFVWTAFGMAAFPLGVALAAVEMQLPSLARAVPIAVGVVVLIAGALQFTAWKSHHLACCREAPGRDRTLPADAGTAWRHGLRTVLRSPHAGPRTRRIQLPIVKSKKPGTLRLGNEMIAEIEARLDMGHES